jgi:hypothetical protein
LFLILISVTILCFLRRREAEAEVIAGSV